MCGPSSAQKNLETEEAQFYQAQTQAYQAAYANFSEISGALNAQFAPILAKGPNQFGFSDAETQVLNTQAQQGTGVEYNKAEQALQEDIAAEGGPSSSTTNIQSGQAGQLKEELASGAASEESQEELGIQEAGYEQGYQEYEGAVRGEEEVAAGWNPNNFASSATSAAGAANNEANAIAQEQNSVWTGVIGALGGIAGSAAGNLNVGPFKSG